MAHILQTEEDSTVYARDREQNYHGPSISAAYRRPYAESDSAENVWFRANNSSLLFRIGLGAVALAIISFFWFMFS